MKKTLLFMAIVVLSLTMMGGLALAGGWTSIDYDANHDPDNTETPLNNANWDPDTGSPHGGFNANSNRCRVCHAVHLANSDSWRLLGSDDSLDPCKACHADSGLTKKRPYGPKDYAPLGEHTLGATDIPDSTATLTLDTGLSCNTCHSVHGAGDIDGVNYDAGTGTTGWNTRLLRLNPNSDSTDLAGGFPGAASGNDTSEKVQTNFCADCHNNNPAWDTTSDDSGRSNNRSHVQGTSADGTLSVNGTDTQVAGFAGDGSQTTEDGCRSCHSATSAGNSVSALGAQTATASAFPHQSEGSKFLFDIYNGDVSGDSTNDPNRVLEGMDEVCGKCHTDTGAFSGANSGVGVSF